MNKVDTNKSGLPVPRLELRWERTSTSGRFDGNTSHKLAWMERTCHYELVIPLQEYDIRKEDGEGKQIGDILRVNLGSTKVTGGGGMPVHENKVDTPFRDGAHARWDALSLNLPIFATCGAYATRITDEHRR